MKAKTTIRGIQELQAYNVRAIAALQPDGAAGEAVQYGLAAAHRYAVAFTHVATGSLRGAHTMSFDQKKMSGVVFINPTVVNPRTKDRPAVYGITEHKRGGSHAFYQLVIDTYGKPILKEMDEIIRGELKR